MSKGKFIVEFKYIGINTQPYSIYDDGSCSFLYNSIAKWIDVDYLDYENGSYYVEHKDGSFSVSFLFNYHNDRFIIDNEYFDLYYICDNVKQKIELC